MKMQESGEMYLETILVLKGKLNNVRAIDVAKSLGYSKPSVSRALGILAESGYIVVAQDGGLTLTKQGEEYASSIYERHITLTKYFESIGVSSDVAENDACRIEHIISDETYNAIKRSVENQQ